MTPVDYMIAVMGDSNVYRQMRLEAAEGAAPYVHARLSSTELYAGADCLIREAHDFLN